MHFPSLYPRALISNRLHNGCTGAHVTDEIMSRCAVSIFFLKLYTGTGSVIEHTNWYAFQFARQQTFETFTYVWTCMLGTVQYLSFDTITNDTFCTIARCVSIFFYSSSSSSSSCLWTDDEMRWAFITFVISIDCYTWYFTLNGMLAFNKAV